MAPKLSWTHVLLAIRIPQVVLVFPYMIFLERSSFSPYGRYWNRNGDVAIGHITAILSVFWVVLDVFLTCRRSSDDEAAEPSSIRARRALGTIAHEAVFFGLWIASCVVSRGEALGFAITENVLYAISLFVLLMQNKPWKLLKGQELKAPSLQLGGQYWPLRAPAAHAEGLETSKEEGQPRESLDSGYGDLAEAEEGKALLK